MADFDEVVTAAKKLVEANDVLAGVFGGGSSQRSRSATATATTQENSSGGCWWWLTKTGLKFSFLGVLIFNIWEIAANFLPFLPAPECRPFMVEWGICTSDLATSIMSSGQESWLGSLFLVPLRYFMTLPVTIWDMLPF
jgi:hypothetical protein